MSEPTNTEGGVTPTPSSQPSAVPRTTATAPQTFEPTNTATWVKPGYAVIVVCVVAVALLVVIGWALVELQVVGAPTAKEADPNAGTIAAIASAGLSALTSLTAAYFGIKMAGEQASQANATAADALKVATIISANSTVNGNPRSEDF